MNTTLRNTLTIGSWGFTTVFISFLFLYIGMWIDGVLKSNPSFMIGLFFLGFVLCISKLYKEAWNLRNK